MKKIETVAANNKILHQHSNLKILKSEIKQEKNPNHVPVQVSRT